LSQSDEVPVLDLSAAIETKEHSAEHESSVESSDSRRQEIELINAALTEVSSHEAIDVHSEDESLVLCDRTEESSDRLSTQVTDKPNVSVWDHSGESNASVHGEAAEQVEMPHSAPEYDEGHDSLPKKDPDKVLSLSTNRSAGDEPAPVRA
jgi:hypothetical protein